MRQNKYLISLTVFCTAYTLIPSAKADQLREAIAVQMKQQEDLVRSVECEYECVFSPTKPQMVAMMREATQQNANTFKQYYVSEQAARSRNYTARWWRKGVKERCEKYGAGNPDVTPDVQAFDGNVLRELRRNHLGQYGVITTPERGHWFDTPRENPFYFLYEDVRTPLSEIIRNGNDYSSSIVTVDGKQGTQITIKHPTINTLSYIFLFNNNRTLVERRGLVTWKPADGPEENHRILLSDYETFADPSGEHISFPRKIIIRRFSQKLPTGIQVEYCTETYTIKSIKFNIPIPDSQFTLDLPQGTRVMDRITGEGFSPTLDTSVWTSPPVRYPIWKSRWFIIVGSAALLSLLGVVVFLFRRRKPDQSPTGAGP